MLTLCPWQQILLQLPIVLDIEFPDNFQVFLDHLKLLKGDLLQYLDIKCAVPMNLYTEFVLAMGVLPMLMGFTHALGWIRHTKRTGKAVGGAEQLFSPLKHFQTLKPNEERLNRIFVITFAFYPFLTTRIAHMLACKSYGPESFQRYDYGISCDDPMYLAFQFFAVCMIVVYPIGIPVVSFWVLWKNREELGVCATLQKEEAKTISRSHREAGPPWWKGTKSTFDFVVGEYRPELYYFEMVEFARKGLLTGVLLGAKQGDTDRSRRICLCHVLGREHDCYAIHR
eukprot:SAG31_NODE_5544_length_2467_cov_1.224240_2_plen_284_part_00